MNTSTTLNDTMNGATKKVKSTEYGSEMNKLSEDASKRVGEVAAQVKDVADEYMASGREYVERGQTYVKDNPERSIAIALGVGAVLGGLITYALRSKK